MPTMRELISSSITGRPKLYANGWELRNNFDCHLASKIRKPKK